MAARSITGALGPALLGLLAAVGASVARPGDPPTKAGGGAPVTTATAPERALNPRILEVMATYPVDGSCGYYWPKGSDWEGTTQDVLWGERRLCRGDPQRRSYCCGLTFEVWVRALLLANGGRPVEGLGGDAMHEARLRFFGDSAAGERRRLVQFALESLKLGEAVPVEQARAGDFVQLWRHDGSGHSAIVVNLLWKDERAVGLTYWSSQTSTRGIGYRSESFGDTGHGVDEAQVYVARAWWPVPRP